MDIVVYTMWLHPSPLVRVAVHHGLISSCVGVKDLASVLGVLLTLAGIAISIGTPIMVAITQVSSHGNYTGAIVFTSSMVFIAASAALYLRLVKSCRWWCIV